MFVPLLASILAMTPGDMQKTRGGPPCGTLGITRANALEACEAIGASDEQKAECRKRVNAAKRLLMHWYCIGKCSTQCLKDVYLDGDGAIIMIIEHPQGPPSA